MIPRFLWTGLFLLGWGIWMFFQIDHFNLPTYDSLFYFAPAAFATVPLHLSTPLLAGFEGADHSWGANCPGGLLLLSCLTPFLPRCSATHTLLFLALWLGISLLTARWVRVGTGRSLYGYVALALCLFNRDFYDIATWQRHDFFGGLGLLGAAYAIFTLAENALSRRGWACLLVSFFLLPLAHPLGLMVGALCLLTIAMLAWRRRGRGLPGYFLPAFAAFCGGVACLIFYFWRDPNAWLLFQDNATQNLRTAYDPAQAGGHFFFGRTFLKRLLSKHFLPGNLIYLAALAFTVLSLRATAASIWRGEARFDRSWPALTQFFFLAVMVCSQFFSNPVYPMLGASFAIAVICAGLRHIEERRGIAWAALLPAALLGISLFYFAAKTWIVGRNGWPDYRRELIQLKDSLPRAHLVLIPYVMWETALDDPQRFALASTINPNQRKLRYEEMIYGRMRSGDLALIDAYDDSRPVHFIGEPEWEKIGEKKAGWSGSEKQQGFDITIWRKR